MKNVAGFDFCKLLTGSLGALAVITQVTLKVKPRPIASVFLTTSCVPPVAPPNDTPHPPRGLVRR